MLKDHMTNWSRREFLRAGAGLPLALQGLQLPTPKETAAPKRIMFICNSLGFHSPNFFPKTRGDIRTSEYLKEMKTAEKMTVFENLFHPGMSTSNHDSEKSFLTGAPSPESPTFVNTISLDQVLARRMGNDTRFPSLNFSLYDRGWGCSWNNHGSAIPPLHDEVGIFSRLFGAEDMSAKKQQLSNDQHVLDCLYTDLKRLQQRRASRGKLEHYLSIISELEAQLNHEKSWLQSAKPVVDVALKTESEFPFSTKIENLFELAKLAFQTDSTRVITFSMDWIYGAISVPGATGGWHTMSHHNGVPGMLDKLILVEIDIVKHLNRFLMDLDQIKEGEGTLLDNTTVVIGSNFGDSSNHTHNSLPTIVAGGGYAHEVHRVLEKPTPLCNLYLELLHKHDVDAGSFGSSEMDMGLLKG